MIRDLSYQQLLDFRRAAADFTLQTVTGREFTVGIYRDGLFFTPISTRSGQSDGRKAHERFIERYNATGSTRPGDYADVTRNASYLLGLLHWAESR